MRCVWFGFSFSSVVLVQLDQTDRRSSFISRCCRCSVKKEEDLKRKERENELFPDNSSLFASPQCSQDTGICSTGTALPRAATRGERLPAPHRPSSLHLSILPPNHPPVPLPRPPAPLRATGAGDTRWPLPPSPPADRSVVIAMKRKTMNESNFSSIPMALALFCII